MTDTRNLNLKEILTKAKEEGKKVNRQLVSYTRKINDFNPLAIFENGKELSQKNGCFGNDMMTNIYLLVSVI